MHAAYGATEFISHTSQFESEKEEKKTIRRSLRPSISPAVLHTRADRIVDHDNGLLFPSIARIRLGESREEQHRGDTYDKMFFYFFSPIYRTVLQSVRNHRYSTRIKDYSSPLDRRFQYAVINDDNSIVVLSRRSLSRKASIDSYFKTRRMRRRCERRGRKNLSGVNYFIGII